MVVDKVFLRLLLTKVFKRVGPEDIAHKTVGRRLTETVNLQRMLVGYNAKQKHENVRS